MALGGSLSAAGIDAGTLIENTATATYEDADGPQSVTSNTVTVRVDELLDVTVVSTNPGAVTTAPGEVILNFEITNQGNGPEAFELVVDPSGTGNDFDTSIDGIAIDTNGDGVYNPGVDVLLTSPEVTPILAADEAITVFVIATVPSDANDGEETEIELTATAVTGSGSPGTAFAAQGEGGGDAIVGTTGATASATGRLVVGVSSVELVKSVSVVDPFGSNSVVPGSTATFTISANVVGSSSVADLIVSDAIPDGTTYAPGTLALDGVALSDATGDDAGEASDSSGVRVELGNVPGGTTRLITFDVTID